MNAYFIKKIEKLGWKKLAKFDLFIFSVKASWPKFIFHIQPKQIVILQEEKY